MDQVSTDNQEGNLYHPEEHAPLEAAASGQPQGADGAGAQASPPPPASAGQPAMVDSGEVITWTASEFVDHQKPSSWYALVGAAGLLIAVVVWLFTRDFFPAIAVLVGVLTLGFYGTRKPREQAYRLDDHGITVGSRHYGYHEFRSFAVMPDGAFLSVELIPLKRFAAYTTIFFDPADEDRILNRLAAFLPLEDRSASLTDSFMRRIHF